MTVSPTARPSIFSRFRRPTTPTAPADVVVDEGFRRDELMRLIGCESSVGLDGAQALVTLFPNDC